MRTVADYQIEARSKISASLFDYIEKYAGFGKTLEGNFSAFSKYKLIPRVLQNITEVDTSTFILEKKAAAPIILAPTAWHKLFCENGEKNTVAATHSFGIPCIISSFCTCELSELGNDLSHVWYQLLFYKDKKLMRKLIEKAEEAGCSGIVMTVDAPLGCSMCAEFENKDASIQFPIQCLPKDEALSYSSLADYYEKYIKTSAGWDDVKEIMSYTKLPIILKGILHPLDVEKAIDIGIKNIIISNHGGRQLDDAISTLDALSLIKSKIKNKIDLYVDGGIRSGTDVFKALALGAKAVLIGRPVLYSLIVNGQQGLLSLLNVLNDELKTCMHLTGSSNIQSITRELLYP